MDASDSNNAAAVRFVAARLAAVVLVAGVGAVWAARTSIDVQANPAANDELKRFGIPRVPAVIVGDRAVHGWNPAGYAELVGVEYKPAVKLAPRVLAARLDRILGSTEALVRLFPESRMEWTPPERKRPIADLAARWHVSPESVRSYVHTARQKDLLTPAINGKAGGELTDKAKAILEGGDDGAEKEAACRHPIPVR